MNKQKIVNKIPSPACLFSCCGIFAANNNTKTNLFKTVFAADSVKFGSVVKDFAAVVLPRLHAVYHYQPYSIPYEFYGKAKESCSQEIGREGVSTNAFGTQFSLDNRFYVDNRALFNNRTVFGKRTLSDNWFLLDKSIQNIFHTKFQSNNSVWLCSTSTPQAEKNNCTSTVYQRNTLQGKVNHLGSTPLSGIYHLPQDQLSQYQLPESVSGDFIHNIANYPNSSAAAKKGEDDIFTDRSIGQQFKHKVIATSATASKEKSYPFSFVKLTEIEKQQWNKKMSGYFDSSLAGVSAIGDASGKPGYKRFIGHAQLHRKLQRNRSTVLSSASYGEETAINHLSGNAANPPFTVHRESIKNAIAKMAIITSEISVTGKSRKETKEQLSLLQQQLEKTEQKTSQDMQRLQQTLTELKNTLGNNNQYRHSHGIRPPSFYGRLK